MARADIFVIEAEDFDYANGQYEATASIMPYLGGAYSDAAPAVAGVDYERSRHRSDSDEYRLGEMPNVPMNSRRGAFSRGEWEVTVNYVIGWTDHADPGWYNYTRDFPAGDYRVYAALSFGYEDPNALDAELGRVVSGVGTSVQTVDPLGRFRADGNGNWDQYVLVPLMQDGQAALVDLSGLETLRFTSLSGDFDHLLFVNQTLSIPEPLFNTVAAFGCLGFALVLLVERRRAKEAPKTSAG